LREVLTVAGFVTQEFFCFGKWYFPSEGCSYANYLSGRPSALQNTLRRKSKKLKQSGHARIEIVTGLTDIQKVIEDYSKVYDASWKVPEPHPNFVPGLIRTCSQQNWLRFGLVFMHDAPVAAQLWIVKGDVAYIHKLAYKEEFASLSAGTILTARMMQHVLDVDRVREIDYLSGDDDYKKAWMSHRSELWGVLAFNPRTVKGTFSMARHIGGRKLKRGIKEFRTDLLR
jgi:Acetyltransferase (GNAT) domain